MFLLSKDLLLRTFELEIVDNLYANFTLSCLTLIVPFLYFLNYYFFSFSLSPDPLFYGKRAAQPLHKLLKSAHLQFVPRIK